MPIRDATPDDAAAILAIYAPIVIETSISFELEPPTEADMRARIAATSAILPWLVLDDAAGSGSVAGYAYAGRHRERAAYRWSVDTTAYVRQDLRGQGIGKALYLALFDRLVALGYYQAFAGIALPNDASVSLHEAVGFEALGIYRRVGFKLGAWRDVGWWQKELQPLSPSDTPTAPRLPPAA